MGGVQVGICGLLTSRMVREKATELPDFVVPADTLRV